MPFFPYVPSMTTERGSGADSRLQFMRKMNAVAVPKMGLPKDDKEDAEKMLKEQR